MGLIGSYQTLEALAHLLSGLVGKGDSQDLPGRHLFMLYQVGDAVRDDARFAAAWPGQNQYRSLCRCDSLALRLIESGENIFLFQHHHAPSKKYDSGYVIWGNMQRL